MINSNRLRENYGPNHIRKHCLTNSEAKAGFTDLERPRGMAKCQNDCRIMAEKAVTQHTVVTTGDLILGNLGTQVDKNHSNILA